MKTIENAKITSTALGREDHGIFTSMIYLEGGGWGVGFGGYSLDEYDKTTKTRVFTAEGGEAINQILETLEVSNWEDLPGKYVRCKFDDLRQCVAIGHLLKDQWFSFKEFFKEYRADE